MSKSTKDELEFQLKWLRNLSDGDRVYYFRELAEKHGEGFAKAVCAEFQRQQQQEKQG
jgi:hypothetical protein